MTRTRIRRVPAPAGPDAPAADIRTDVLPGLRSRPRSLPPKLFYDDRGARLFEQICRQPEYYPTRTELCILERHLPDIAALAGPRCAVIEYGSGQGIKTRRLLDALEAPASYTAVEISARQLEGVTNRLRREYPHVPMHPVHADYTRAFGLPALPPHARKLAFFPGSTIGNFHPGDAARFLRNIRDAVGRDGALVLGVDRRKDPAILDPAYNDAAGVTAQFNLNMLARLNRELGADFDLSRFRHRAFFNAEASRIEMHLESLEPQEVTVAGETFHFDRGETIWTECSYKYDAPRLDALVERAGFQVVRRFTDPDGLFWVVFLDAA